VQALALIVCHARGRVIGRGRALPWHVAEDLKHFKQTTLGHAVLMGRRTHESIGRALPGRRNLVLTGRPDYRAEGCEVFDSLPAALEAARTRDACPFVIGGASLYEQALPRATLLYVSELQRDVAGDVFFPTLQATNWRETERRESDDGQVIFRTLRRIG